MRTQEAFQLSSDRANARGVHSDRQSDETRVREQKVRGTRLVDRQRDEASPKT